jgi:hypothetical protein
MIKRVFAAAVSAPDLTSALEELEAEQRALDARRAALIAEWDAAGEWTLDGSATPAACLARRTRVSGRVARERVRVARRLRSMPCTTAAVEELGWPKVRLLAAANDERTASAFAVAEAQLVQHALRLSVDQLSVLLAHWRRMVDADGASPRHEHHYVELHESWKGEGFLQGVLDPESNAIVKGVLDEIAAELYRSERTERATAMLRGEEPPPLAAANVRTKEALVEMARRAKAATAAAADGGPTSVRPARPLVLVHLEADADARLSARLASGAPLAPDAPERLLCDAAIAKVVSKEGDVPLSLGRTVRSPTEGQRRALGALWGGCAFPGCDRPFTWCELHHVDHWEKGGTTDVDKLLPLCSKHHHLHHRGTFDIRRRDGTFWFVRADGEDIAPARAVARSTLAAVPAA